MTTKKRKDIITKLGILLRQVMEAYTNDVQSQNTSGANTGVQVETSGYLQLNNTYNGIDKEGDSYEIDTIHTDKNKHCVHVLFENDHIDLDWKDISEYNLLEIIKELEFFINVPDKIEIYS